MGKTYQSTVVEAPAAEVWKTIRDFHDMSWAPNVITKVEAVGGQKGDQTGARRVLNDAFHETLLELDDSGRLIRYSIDQGPPPVSSSDVKNYEGVLRLLPVTEDGTTFVEWSSSWQNNDQACAEFCQGIYVALLADMKQHFS
ncbi:MAG: SRPBCC family protein [Candidatus Glassbacteria bacterium]|nr:SRPBCC family protein [Candidatus Glassbacteria bacterium]